MIYIKTYGTGAKPNASKSLDRKINISELANRLEKPELRNKIQNFNEYGDLNFWDFGVRASKYINPGDRAFIFIQNRYYFGNIVSVVKDSSGEIGDEIEWHRQFYDTPWKNICLIDGLVGPKELDEGNYNKLIKYLSSFGKRDIYKLNEDDEVLSSLLSLSCDISEKTVKSDIEAEKIEEGQGSGEGRVREYYGKRYERDPKNRTEAIRIHGLTCNACGFNFEKQYGTRGTNYIEVHHVKPISTFENEQNVNPKTDLITVCSNCHRMIHRKYDDVLTIED